ncbi:hypothetical protein CRE_28650 [Caenorhabditis remanei]|uniref:G-protein coupled receptors family 1 profile domain-containing protein n=1 Tax=Caenorhabditis remanei TaxID=31234 RepID=E3MJU6_CAERE|nr:hypothetical protein CRE_28650 [Caenorhabditis remanei]
MNPDTSDFGKTEQTNTTSYQMPLVVYYVLFVIITPIYFLILVCILKLRRHVVMFKSTFYTILVQHSISDISALIFYAFQKVSYVLISNFLYNYQRYRFAAVFYDGIYWSFVFRTNGIAFMTIHRFLIIVKPAHKITRMVQQFEPWKIWVVFWIPSLILSAICFSDLEIGFDSPEKMLLAMDPSIISRYTRVIFLYLLVVCVVCVILYGLIIKSIRTSSHSVTKSFQREIRLALQVSLSFAAQVVLLIYLFFSYIFAEMDNTAQIVNLRRFFPLAYGTLSFIGPFTILIFNKDVSKEMKLMIFGKKLILLVAALCICYSVCDHNAGVRFYFCVFIENERTNYIVQICVLYNIDSALYYNGLYWCIVFRVNGILFMTIHRFLIIVKPLYKVTWYIQQAKPWKIWIMYWIPSVVFSAVCFPDTEISFDYPENMALVMDSAIISKATRISFIYLLFTCSACVISYGLMIKFIRVKSHSMSKSLRREIRLAFQVFLSFSAQLILLIYLSCLNVFAVMDNVRFDLLYQEYYNFFKKEGIVKTRKYYPLVYGILSFIGPFTILIFNNDVSRRIQLIILGNRMVRRVESLTTSTSRKLTDFPTTRF